MTTDTTRATRAGRRLLLFGLGTPLLISAIALAPKDTGYAATQRLLLTGIMFVVLIVGIAGTVTARRAYQEARLHSRYAAASSAVRDTLSYLRQERRLARRGQLPAIVAGLGAATLTTLSYWPQLEPLAPFRQTFAVLAIGFLAVIPLAAFHNRGAFVNTLFLRRYLRQQLHHIGFRPERLRLRLPRKASRTDPPVTVTGDGSFTAGGFAWWFDDFTMNVIVFGQTGSGKTACILNSLLEGLVASSTDPALRIAGLLLDAKGDFRGKLERLCERYDRADDLFVIDPASWATHGGTRLCIAWNPLDNDDDALEVAVRLVTVLRLLGLEQGNEGSFFLDSAKIFLRHIITLLRAARLTEIPCLADIHRLCQEPDDDTPFYHAVVAGVSERYPGDVPGEAMDALAYMEKEWGPMADRQKSAVRSTIIQLLDEFLIPPFNEMFAGKSTISIADAIDQGRILYIDMPAADRERMSRVVSTLIKLEYQRNILTRPGKARRSFMLADEFQTFYTSGEGRGDSDFFERSRESRHANIVAAQNLPAFLKRTRNPNDVKNFLGNCAVKILLRNGEDETNRWASALFGQRSEIVITTNEQAAFNGTWFRRRHTSYGRANRVLPRVPPERFLQLIVPTREAGGPHHAEAMLHLGSRGETAQATLTWPLNLLG